MSMVSNFNVEEKEENPPFLSNRETRRRIPSIVPSFNKTVHLLVLAVYKKFQLHL